MYRNLVCNSTTTLNSFKQIMAKGFVCAIISSLMACGGNTGQNPASQAPEAANHDKSIKNAKQQLVESENNFKGGLYVPDNELTVSEVYGADLVFSGYQEKYVVEINDDDGVASVNFQLKKANGDTVKILPFKQKNIGYVATLDPDDVEPGLYKIEVEATGVDGGEGNLSGKKVVSYDIDIKGSASTSVMERF